MKKTTYLSLIFIFSLSFQLNAQWKINETFDSEIPTSWTGDLGDPGFYWVSQAGGHSGIAKGSTGASSATREFISPSVEVSAGDSLFFNHFLIVSNSEDFSFHYRVNSGAWTELLNSDASYWVDEEFSLSQLSGISTGDIVDFKFSIENEASNFCYIDYFKVGKTPPSNVPDCPQLILPQNNETDVSVNPFLFWNSVSETDEYLINFGTDNPPSNILNLYSNDLDTFYQHSSQLDFNQIYYWQIVPSNSIGQPTGCDIFSFTTKTDFFPLIIDFEYPNAALPPNWIVEEGGTNSGMASWHGAYNNAGNGHNNSNGFLSISLNYSEPKDSWFISEPLPLNADKLYKITFYYQTLAQGAYEYMEVKYGNEQSIAGMQTQIWDNQYINSPGWKKGVCFINPDSDGDYYLSWHAYSEPAEFNLMLDDITIEELDNGPGAYTQPYTKTLPITAVNDSSDFSLQIKNQGSGNLELISAHYPQFIEGPQTFSIADSQIVDFKFKPLNQTVFFDTITLETNGGNLDIPVFSNSAKTVYPINSILTMNDHFTVIDNDNNSYTWQMYTQDRTFEGEYAFQVQENYDETGYDDWLITEPVYVLPDDIFTFIAHSRDGFSGPGQIEILLSTSAGNTVNDFDVTIEPVFYINGHWTGYSFDLSEYAGQIVTLAIHSTSSSAWTMAHFFDNIGMPANENPIYCTSIQYPQNGQTGVPVDTTLYWNEQENANDYYLFLGTDNPPTNLLNGVSCGDITNYNISDLDFQTTYYWQVIPFYENFQAQDCDINSFTTEQNIDIEQKFIEQIKIFTNGNIIFVNNLNISERYKIKVFSADGRCLFKENDLSKKNIKIDLNYNGLVIVLVENQTQSISKKLLLLKK